MSMSRKELIYELTKYEMDWLIQNVEFNDMLDFYEFFASGGFYNWSDKALQQKYDDSIKEDN
jgi:hypothetical protein